MNAPAPWTRGGTLSYRPLSRVEIRHPFFQDGQFRDMSFRPLPETAGRLAHLPIRARAGHGTLDLFAEEGLLESLWATANRESLHLDFLVIPNAPGWRTWTAAHPDSGQPRLDLSVTEGPQGCPWDASCPGDLPRGMAPEAAMARLRLNLSLESKGFGEWQASLGRTCILQFQARQTFWKYVFLGDWQDHSLRILDPTEFVQFTAPQLEVLPDGQAALTIRSLQTIGLSERPSQRFQLRDVAANPERLLIKRIPVADPRRFHQEPGESGSLFISEIFITH